ncbi:hypothetical protein [Actinocorallia longicatena]|uniref:Glucosamine kinase n=1 Tax=Actinocorallia longicatena TaxID=111803 RepID=A0ABP6QCI9_9ACTN
MDSESSALIAGLADGPGGLPGVRWFRALPQLGDLSERPVTADQTHRSVIVGERLVVKWFSPPPEAPHRALDLLGHLAAVGFTATAAPYAAVLDGDGRLSALITDYLPDGRDGWEWCTEAAISGEPAGPLLGALAADLHAALATPSALIPEPVSASAGAGAGWHARALAALEEASELDPWPGPRAERMRAELAPLAEPGPTPVLRIHGDLHVGQVLEWRGGHAVIDFDGNPTVAAAETPQPAARDVAQLLTSLEHVGQVAAGRGADSAAWTREACAGFLAAYTGGLAAHGRSELFDERLLRPFAVEQECRELIYAARFLPRWRYAPLGVLRSWYETEDPIEGGA